MGSRTQQLLHHSLSNSVPSALTQPAVKVREQTLVSIKGQYFDDDHLHTLLSRVPD